MKLFLIEFALVFFLCAFQGRPDIGALCKDNEEVVLSFTRVNGKKAVGLRKDKSGKYLVYGFGTNSKIEPEYPKRPDASS